jgi:Ca-activated chloride channel family protein
MNHSKTLTLALGLILTAMAAAQPMKMPEQDKTLSPYFLIKSDDPSLDQLPLLSTKADVNVAGVIADVTVTQVYKNDGKRPIEAIYTFPASTRAAVYAMKMTIGDRTIVARIREREKARQDYEAAKQKGQTASLLEQERPNVFQMNVANIMPGDFIKVEMSYTELLVPTDGVYEFAYPTVVGPRYSNIPEKKAKQSDAWVKSPYLHEGNAPSYDFGMAVTLSAGLPIQEISCPSHKTQVRYQGLNTASVNLDAGEKKGGNRDFILRYRLAGGKIESGLLLFQGKDENFFLAMVQPPKRVDPSAIPPREYIFIVDVSGSMHGFPLDISKTLLRNLLTGLRPRDYFNVLLFAGVSAVMAEKSVSVNEKNIDAAIEFIDKEQGSGGTEVLPALQRALALPRTEGTSRTMVIATDGYVTVEVEAFDLIREKLGEANLFAFGIGSGVNRYIIEGMARVGMGEPFVIEKQDGAAGAAEKFRKYIATPVLTGIDVSYGGFAVYDVEPKTIPDVLAERPIIIFGKWRGSPKGSITLTGTSGSGKYREVLNLADARPDVANSALRYLWARHRIQLLADYNNLQEDSGRIKEVTNLGLKYNLLTAYTSFIAIDSKIRNKDGQQETVEQALPLPEGVSDYALGVGASGGFSGAGRGMGKSMIMRSAAPVMGAVAADELAEAPAPPVGQKQTKDGGWTGYTGGATAGSVQVAKVVVTGLSEKNIRTAIEQALSSLLAAYQSALSAQAGLKGRVIVKFTVQADGTVGDIKFTTSELGADVEAAVRTMLEALTFTNHLGKDVAVAVTLSFKP